MLKPIATRHKDGRPLFRCSECGDGGEYHFETRYQKPNKKMREKGLKYGKTIYTVIVCKCGNELTDKQRVQGT